jgi:hypothetical protein
MSATSVTVHYPEHEKLSKIADASQACGEFLEWLGEQGYHLGRFHTHSDGCMQAHGEGHTPDNPRCPSWLGACLMEPNDQIRTCGFRDSELYPSPVNLQRLLAQFYNIDENKLEAEKRAMLEALRHGPV